MITLKPYDSSHDDPTEIPQWFAVVEFESLKGKFWLEALFDETTPLRLRNVTNNIIMAQGIALFYVADFTLETKYVLEIYRPYPASLPSMKSFQIARLE